MSQLERYSYAPNNGPLTKVTYGNGDEQEILYDKEEHIKSRRWNGQSTDAVRYQYDAYGTLEKETDLVNGRIDCDQYDMTGRLVQSSTLEKNAGVSGEPTEANTHTVQSLEISYDSYDRVNRLVQCLEGSKTKTGFIYGDASKAQRPGLAYGLSVDGVARQTLEYDAMARRTKETVTLPGGQTRENCFVYGTINHLTDTDSLLSSMSNGTDSWAYEYDNVGNITKIVCGEKSITYQYDELNQLIRENNGVLGKTILYTYDAGGNMTSRKTYAYTEGAVSTVQTQDLFTYRTDGWKDQLMSWNGQPYAYDAGGNPIVLRGVALTWGEGRRLKKVSLSWGDVTFAYDSDGKRVRKSSSGVDTKYFYNGNTLSGLTKGNTTVQFLYDAEGKPFLLRLNETTDYFYLYNGLRDVVGLVDSNNQVVVRYQYNSWGKVTSTQDTSGVSLAALNPFRYRKYVYDPETGLYCLGSRYYDPEVGRFINADDFETLTYQMDSVQGKNLYQYCFNNPVNMQDEDGGWPKWVTQVLVGTAVIAAAAVLTVATAGTGTALACFAVGALKGAAVGAASGAVNGAITGVIGNRIATGSWSGSAAAALNGAAEGYMSGAITGFVVGGVTSNVCFVAGTLVHLADRDTEIENVSAGDLVWAENPETKEKALKRVVRTFCNQSDELVQIKTPQEEITATLTHPFYVKEKGWVRAGDLQRGDRLCLRDGTYTLVVLIHRKKLKTTVSVYNFEVEDFHTYYVGIQGILVHNTCHGNSLKTNKKTDLCVLRDNQTGAVKKIGETTRGVRRYTKKYYAKNNVTMYIFDSGSKYRIHYQQNRIIRSYYKRFGKLPQLNTIIKQITDMSYRYQHPSDIYKSRKTA